MGRDQRHPRGVLVRGMANFGHGDQQGGSLTPSPTRRRGGHPRPREAQDHRPGIRRADRPQRRAAPAALPRFRRSSGDGRRPAAAAVLRRADPASGLAGRVRRAGRVRPRRWRASPSAWKATPPARTPAKRPCSPPGSSPGSHGRRRPGDGAGSAGLHLLHGAAGGTLAAVAGEHHGTSGERMRVFEADRPSLRGPDRIHPGRVPRIFCRARIGMAERLAGLAAARGL